MDCKLYTQQQSVINGRGVWLYLLDTSIGYIFVVEYERLDKELKRFIFDGEYDKAEKKYLSCVKAILNGKL